MIRYMVIKFYPDGTQKAEFFDEHDLVKAYLLLLRGLERSYNVFYWSSIGHCYVLCEEWSCENS